MFSSSLSLTGLFESSNVKCGAASNYNRVFELSSGEYFKWAAYDDVLAPEFLEKCVYMLDNDPSVVGCICKTGRIDKDGNFYGNNLITKVASGLAAPSVVNGEVTINFISGAATNGTYTGDTNFTQTPHVVFGVAHSGTHPDADSHWWSATITSLTASELKIKMDSTNIGLPPNLYYWLAIGI